MSSKNKRENYCFYWVKIDGYTNKYAPFYFNTDNQFRVEVNDRTLFLSEYKLELMFGKGCIIRKVDFDNDIAQVDDENENKNAFMYYVVETDSGSKHSALFNPAINLGLINGIIAPINVSARLVYKPIDEL